MTWVNVKQKNFPSRLKTVILTHVDFIDLGQCQDFFEFLQITDKELSAIETILRYLIQRKYEIENFWIWSIWLDEGRRCYKIILDSPNFASIPAGVEPPMLEPPPLSTP